MIKGKKKKKKKKKEMLVTFPQSRVWCLQIASFVQPAV